ncbi:MAG: DEAD/DEAH box helicase, partial [Desulfobacterales bacterium]|nr:DEAD/DEAH box helicase [Desulfobacterales bacterium]
IQWNYLILDEAQYIKNPRAQTTRAIKKIPSNHRLSMTGTPVENSPVDLWSQFDFLMPGFLGGLKNFKERCAADARGTLEELRKSTGPFILRRLKSQVCRELPLKTEITRFCDFAEEQKRLYDQTLLAGREGIEKKKRDDAHQPLAVHMLTLLLRLRQIACHPSLVPDAGPGPRDSGKQEEVMRAAGEILAEGHKMLIFSQFTAHLKLMRKSFEAARFKTYYLAGETRNRIEVIERFNNSEEPCVFFISLKAGGLGLNLTNANYVFLLDPWWNPAVENQAIDRCHRIGQENPVTVYRFITKGSIEEKVSAMKEVKKRMERAVITEADIDAVPLSEEALARLLLER